MCCSRLGNKVRRGTDAADKFSFRNAYGGPGNRVSTAENKRIAEADVRNVGPQALDEKLSYYANDAVVWDSVMRVMGFSDTNTVSGIDEVRKFFTWLASLPPVNVKILGVFGEGDNVAVEWMLSGGEGPGKFEIPCANIY